MKIVIPMSGQSSRFVAAGYKTPKYLLEIDGKRVIEHIIDLYPKDSEFVFIINDKHKKETDVVKVLKKAAPDSVIVTIPSHKKGPVHSVLQVSKYIDDHEPVIVNYCDFSMQWDYEDFEEFIVQSQCDGCVVCYTGFHPHMLGSDNYAFCKTDDEKIVEIREKQPFTEDKMSEFASTGTYYFREGSYIKKYFQQLIDEDININGEYYVSLVHNLMINDGLYNKVYEVPTMLQWGTPLDLDMYLQWSNYYKDIINREIKVEIPNCTTVIPMAGAGSRFAKEGFLIPKPFIPVNDKYMVDQAVRCLPKTDRTIYAARSAHMSLMPLQDYPNVVWVDEVTQGQACTTEKILELVEDGSILVSACDNGITYDETKLIDLVNDESNDIIVWSYRNNFTSHHNPDMYSWLDVDDEGNVRKVNVKKYVGENPVNDYAIVGTMFFRSKDVYLNSLNRLYESKVTTNGEYYIDNLLNDAIDLGYKVKNFEVDHYICWGTPNDLKTYQYWQRFFNQVDWHPYEYSRDYFTN